MALSKMKFPFDIQLGDWQERMLGQNADGIQNEGFWNDQNEKDQDLGPMRILVCGNAGVGKSTLINKVFGTVATTVSKAATLYPGGWLVLTYYRPKTTYQASMIYGRRLCMKTDQT